MTPVQLSPHDPQRAAARLVRLDASEVTAPLADAGRHRRSSGVLALMAALALAAGPLAGCSDSGSVSGSASGGASASATASASGAETGASASASASPSATLSAEDVALRDAALAYPAPERPGDMDTNDGQGAAATANYFVNLYRYAFVTGDVSGLEEMSGADCTFCDSMITNASNLHDAGGWMDPWNQEVLSLKYYEPVQGNAYSRVDVVATFDERTTHDPDGTIGVIPAQDSPTTLALAMYYEDDHWMIWGGEVVDE